MSRRANREKVFQLLFSADNYAPEEMEEQIRLFFEDEKDRYIEKKLEEAEEKGVKGAPEELVLPASFTQSREEVTKRVESILPVLQELDKKLNR